MPDTTQPLVSVLTPSYNQAAWLGDNLSSVACQSYPRIEHVVADGGSSDSTVELLQAAGDSVSWVSEPDGGQADAINKAFARSTGDIIGWINSDDAYVDCDVISDVVACFLANPGVDVVYGHGLQTTADGAVIQILWAPPFDADLLSALDFITQPAAFVRREALGERMLDDSFHFALDYELWLRLASTGHGFLRLDRFTGIDRHQPDRKSATIKDVHAQNLERLATMYDTRFGPEWEADRSAFYRRQRLMGALQIPRLHPDRFAFSAPEHPKRGLLRRQALSRKSDWPEEYR